MSSRATSHPVKSESLTRPGEDSDNLPAATVLHKSDSIYRWHILGLNCVLLFGTCYAVDIPAAIKTQMSSAMGSPDNFETMYSLLFTLYSMPNIFFPFFSGYFVDKLGTRYCLLVFTSLVLSGQVIFAIGMSVKSWPVMFLGRILYGFGDASIYVTNSTFIAEYFGNGKELGFAYAFNLSTARVGSVVNNILSPILVRMGGVSLALWAGAMLMGVSVLSVLLMFPIDIYLDGLIAKNNSICTEVGEISARGAADIDPLSASLRVGPTQEGGGLQESNARLSNESNAASGSDLKLSDAMKLPRAFYILNLICLLISAAIFCLNNVASSLLLERDYFKVPPDECTLDTPYLCQGDGNNPLHCPSSTNYQPPLPVNLTYKGEYYSELTWGDDVDCSEDKWSDGCAKDFCNRFDDAILVTNTIMSIPYTMTSILLPLCGLYVDKYGKIAIILLVSSIVCFADHMLLATTEVTPIALMVGQGFVYSAFSAAIWPSIPLVVPPKYLSLAFGIVFSTQAIGLTLVPIVMAEIYNQSNSEYIPNVELFLAAIAFFGMIASIWINYYDCTYGNNVLNDPPADHRMSVDPTSEPLLSENCEGGSPICAKNRTIDSPQDRTAESGGDTHSDDDVLSTTCSDANRFDSLYSRKVFGEVVVSPLVSEDNENHQIDGIRQRSRSRSLSRAERLSGVSVDERVKELAASHKK